MNRILTSDAAASDAQHCPECGLKVKHFARHLRRVHNNQGGSAKARLRALARELGVESWRILSYLFDFGLNSSSIDKLADEIREHFPSAAPYRTPTEKAPAQPQTSRGFLSEPRPIPVVTLPFELLPPGTWDLADILAHYRNHAGRRPTGIRDSGLDEERIRRIESLKPAIRWVGKKQWLGYIVFEFAQSSRVVLECPFKGNATYILWGNWQKMVLHPKRYVWKHFPQKYKRIVHTGGWNEWIQRIRSAVGLR